MRITIAALGTRGDVQPMVALGKGLAAAGHRVTIVAGSNFREWIGRYGLGFVPTVDMETLRDSPDGVAWSKGSAGSRSRLRALRALVTRHGRSVLEPLRAAAGSTDLYVSGFAAGPLVQAVSEKSGVPFVNALLQPLIPTRSGPASLRPVFSRRDSAANLWSGRAVDGLAWSVVGEATNACRAELDLPPHRGDTWIATLRAMPSLLGFSRHVVPPPKDWPSNAVLTGYWFLDEETGWRVPPALREFLADGSPPVYIGFGSMTPGNVERTRTAILEAVRLSGLRVVVSSVWGGLETWDLPDTVCAVGAVPHAWLFRRVAAVVHHGGAGTTAAALRAGKPALVVPHVADQPYWGRRVHEIGAGVAPIARRRLTAPKLAEALRRLVFDSTLRLAAEAIGERIRAERGVEAAVDAVGRVRNARAVA